MELIEGKVFRTSADHRWHDILTEIWSNTISGNSTADMSGDRQRERTVPFSEVLTPLMRIGARRFKVQAGKYHSVLQPSAILDLEHYLLTQLCYLANRCLGKEFYSFRLDKAPASALVEHWCATAETFEIYDDFVARMRSGDILRFLYDYPVLSRLLCQTVVQWLESVTELCIRADADAEWLGRAENADRAGMIKNARAGLSDQHHNGRTVIVITLRDGRKIVYKPRGLAGERIFNELLQLLNRLGIPDRLRTVSVVDRGNYGWMEHVEHAPCETDAEIESYFRRSGINLCMCYILAATDIHYENIIASGEHPVLVDLEALLCDRGQAKINNEDGVDLPYLLQIGMLPLGRRAPEFASDLSALGQNIEMISGIPHLFWSKINCDQMMAMERKSGAEPVGHQPTFHGMPAFAASHVDAVVEGFVSAYELVRNERELFCQTLCTLDNTQIGKFRVIIRNSATYSDILEHLLKPQFLKDGIDRSIELEWLARPLSGPYRVRTGRVRLFEHESSSMEHLDIPHITLSQWADLGLVDDDDFFRYHQLRDISVACSRLQSMTSDDREHHVSIIRDALSPRV
jgi:type 2 lantibiotic biosynthesis protein LanM